MKKIVLSSLLVLGMTGAAFAQGTTDFATLDADMNGGLSLTEAQVGWPDLTAEDFAAADTDGNGELSPEEYGVLTGAAAPAN